MNISKYINPKSVSIITSLIILFSASNIYARTEYTIKKGDSLYKIAKKYNVDIKDLQRDNNINANKMKPGQKINIPSETLSDRNNLKQDRHKKEKALTNRITKTNKSAKASHKSPSSASDSVYYLVRKGDTLSSIAKKYSINIRNLKELNNLKSSKLKNGQKLLVKQTDPKVYIVKKSDNIGKIAKKFDLDAAELMTINGLESDSLKIGQKVYLKERIEAKTFENKILENNIEDELKNVSETDEFLEKDKPDRLVIFAKKLMNIPYKFGGSSIFGIDCSGYVKKVYGLLGIELPRSAREQYNAGGEPIEKEELSLGDLVFFRTYASFPSHVGIYLGNNLFIHASSKGKKVTIDSLETPYYFKRFIGGKRVLKEETPEAETKG